VKIGIFGGVFDPIHFGHLQGGEGARVSLGLDKVLFTPSHIPPHKPKSYASSKDRIAMVNIALEENQNFICLDIEAKREGISYTIDTAKEIKRLYGENEYYFIIGQDTIPELPTWKDYKTLILLVKFVAIKRSDFSYTDPDITIIEYPTLPVSSTMIRERIKQGLSIKYLVPDGVLKYIQKHGLYM